jgi:hypothetical protein
MGKTFWEMACKTQNWERIRKYKVLKTVWQRQFDLGDIATVTVCTDLSESKFIEIRLELFEKDGVVFRKDLLTGKPINFITMVRTLG